METNRNNRVLNIILIVMAILIIYQNITMRKEILYMRNYISNIEPNLSQTINNLNYSILNSIEGLLNEQQNMVSDYRFTYKGVNLPKETVKALIEFKLKQSDASSKIYLNVVSQGDNGEEDYECMLLDGFSYACEIDLSFKENYTFNIYQRSLDGGHRILNSSPYQNYIKEDFDNRVNIDQSGIGSDKERSTFSFSLTNKTFGEEYFKIKNIVAKAFHEEKEVFSEDITNFNIVNSESREKINVMIASGQIDPETIPEVEYGQMFIDEKGVEHGDYMVTILHSETGAPAGYNNFPKYSFKIIITSNNGDIFEF